jgi:hypothetical protein
MTLKHILLAAGLVLAAAPAFAGNVDNEPHSWMLLTHPRSSIELDSNAKPGGVRGSTEGGHDTRTGIG